MHKSIPNILKTLQVNSKNFGTASGLNWLEDEGPFIESYSPVDGKLIGGVYSGSRRSYDQIVNDAEEAFKAWRKAPAPQRGEVVRQMGLKLREKKEELGTLVSYEMGKSLQEGLGEVQEMIDICDFAVGLSRQLYGLTMHSERPGHRMYEQWHPLGIVGIISAFNFPVAVWSWNAAIAWVCGDVTIWKPSEKVPLTAIACQKIIQEVLQDNDIDYSISNLIIGDAEVGKWMSSDPRVPLVSATGSTRMGKAVGEEVGKRLGKAILELGGNNAIIISQSAFFVSNTHF